MNDRSPALASAACAPPGNRSYRRKKAVVVEAVAATDGSGRGKGDLCPVALACKKALPGCEPHIEGPNPYVVLPDGSTRRLFLSPDLIEEIGRFDRGEGGFKNTLLIEVS